jgi:hypothetical protein
VTDLAKEIDVNERTCSLPGCEARHCARGLCKKHYYAAGYGFSPRRCRVVGCERMTTTKTGDGLCENHYARVRRHGTTHAAAFNQTRDMMAADVLHLRSAPHGDCVLWTGGLTTAMYPNEVTSEYGTMKAHRLSWTMANGPIPDGMTLDHVCHTLDLSCAGGDECLHRRCINPDHLEPVTQSVNSWRRNHRAEAAKVTAIAGLKDLTGIGSETS